MTANAYLDHQIYDHDATITGTFRKGITVRQGATVRISGFVEGPLHVEEGSLLELSGTYAPSQGGTIAGVVHLKGILNGDPSGLEMPGGILMLMAPALVMNGSETWALTAEGTIVPAEDDLVVRDPKGAWAFHPKIGDFRFYSQQELDELAMTGQIARGSEGAATA